MTRFGERLDHAAGSVAAWLLRWAATRHISPELTWIHALGAEVDEVETGWARLTWALGVVRVLWIESRTTRRHTWLVRLGWIGSAGGLGAWRAYVPALVGGIAMTTWSYWHRGEDIPVPVFAAIVTSPYYMVVGFCWGRTRNIQTAALMGAATALIGFELTCVATAVYASLTASSSYGGFAVAIWLMFGLAWVLPVGFVGALSGLLGGVLAHPVSFIRSLRR